jgi:hypothetical protein
MQEYKLDVKFLEIIVNLVREQNEQLLTIVAEQEKISKKKLAMYIPTKFALKQMILQYLGNQEHGRSPRAPATLELLDR